MSELPPVDPALAIRAHLQWGVALTAALVLGLGGWAVATEISGAVIASGHLVVESNVKKVQHLSGGVVGEILVREGRRVEAGEVVMRLDPTVSRANLAVLQSALDQFSAREARLKAEVDLRDAVETPERLAPRILDREVSGVMLGEDRLFDLRAQTREGQKSQMRERVSQLEKEIVGQTAQSQAKDREIALIRTELESVTLLYKKGLAPVTRVNALQREQARIEGELGLLGAQISSARGKIGEVKLQIIQVDQQFVSDAAKELRELEGRLAELSAKEVAARDQLDRIDIRAPQVGVVHDLAVFTVGGVINPGETIMTIVPDRDRLTVDVKIAPKDVSHLHAGQPVTLHIAAVNQKTTRDLTGTVARVGVDVTTDQRSGEIYYGASIRIDEDRLGSLEPGVLVPGMPVEAFIRTQDRSVMSYLTKPLTDQIRRAFRDG